MTQVSGNIGRVRGFLWVGRQMAVRLSTTAVFGDLAGYFFGNVTDKVNNRGLLHGDMLPPVDL